MQGIRPEALTDSELLRYVYLMLDKPLPHAWAVELYARLHRKKFNKLPDNYLSLRSTPAPAKA